jgi:hypothetical protein
MEYGTRLKASIVLQAIVEGLKDSQKDPTFKLDMTTFGKVTDLECCGCASTVALFKLFGKEETVSQFMRSFLEDDDREDLEWYEEAFIIVKLRKILEQTQYPDLPYRIDLARKGKVSALILIFGHADIEDWDNLWKLENNNWKEQIPKIEMAIAEMRVAGY